MTRVAGRVSAAALFLIALGATLVLGFRDPGCEYVYEAAVFVLAACWSWKGFWPPPIPGLLLAAIAAWGFGQIALGTTVYRYVTLQGALRAAALAATAVVSYWIFLSRRLRIDFLRAFAGLGVFLAVISVLAYFTSPGKILWTFDALYPDVWGPFLSRNNFAQFLELAMPVALWFAFSSPRGNALYLLFGAIMLAAGLTSASRAGAVVLVMEAALAVWTRRDSPLTGRLGLRLACATILFAAVPGIGTLAGRLTSPNPYQGRKEIAQASLQMIWDRPWTGFGLGTFGTVYPAYAVFDEGKLVEHAHNDLLEWASEGGVAFALIWIGLALWSLRPALRSGWGIGVLGCFLHCLVDYPFARFGISAWVFILLGMLARTELREVRHRVH